MYTQKIALAIIFGQIRLGVENKFLENRSGRILRSTSLFYKILPTNLDACKPTFYTFYTSHLRRYVYRTDFRQLAVSLTIVQDKLHPFNIQDHRSTRGLLAKPLKTFPKSRIRPAGFNLLTSAKFAKKF